MFAVLSAALMVVDARVDALKPVRSQMGLVLTPFYWMMMTAALAAAAFDLMRRPHFWSKTEHGLSSQDLPAPLGRRRRQTGRGRQAR